MTRTKERETTFKIITVIITIIACISLAEIVLRFGLPHLKKSDFRKSRYPGVIYEYKPNLNFYHQRHQTQITLNSHGFRDKEFSKDKPEGLIRILCLGDSATYGHGIKNVDETYPAMLEKILNENSKIPFETYNMGVEGYNTHHEVAVLKHKGLKFNPDIAIIALNFGDAGRDWIIVKNGQVMNNIPRPPFLQKAMPDSVHDFLANNLLIYYYLDIALYRHFMSFSDKYHFYSNMAEKTHLEDNIADSKIFDEKSLLDFKQICQKHNLHCIVAIMPWFNIIVNETSPELQGLQKLIAFLKNHNIEYVDLFKPVLYENADTNLEIHDYMESLKVSKTDPHPNEKALKLYAEEIADYILNKTNQSITKTIE